MPYDAVEQRHNLKERGYDPMETSGTQVRSNDTWIRSNGKHKYDPMEFRYDPVERGYDPMTYKSQSNCIVLYVIEAFEFVTLGNYAKGRKL